MCLSAILDITIEASDSGDLGKYKMVLIIVVIGLIAQLVRAYG